MTESNLKKYFENKINSQILTANLNGIFERFIHDITQVDLTRTESESTFNIEPKHLNKILNDTLKGNFTFDNLKNIASGLMFSEFFNWDSDTEIGNRIATIIVQLDNTEINFPISIENLKLWKEYLDTGIHKLKII
jgi:hypothetical protein